jgi:tetratricopeptide (TPR) repeat protein
MTALLQQNPPASNPASAQRTELSEVMLAFAKGLALHQAGRLADAEKIYNLILAAHPDHFDSLHLLGVMAHQRGDHAAAIRQIDLALKRNPDDAFALNNRGNALHALKRHEEALASYDRALAIWPDYDDARCNRGAALHELKRYEEALTSCDGTIARQPDYAEAHSNRGNTLRALKRYEEALASCDRAIALQPDFADAHCNRGNALHELKRFEEALASYDRALAGQPNDAKALTNRGVTLQNLKRFDEALASYERAIAVGPDYVEAHYQDAMCRMQIGDFKRGWEKHECRWESEQLRNAKRNFTQPLWLGSDEIKGKTVLLHAEQGFGDTIQFCRYVPFVVERAAHVILEVQRPLHELMSTLPGGARIVSRDEKLGDFDVHCPLLSLPLAFGTMLGTIPSETPYLRASAEAAANWHNRLGPSSRPKIGLAWSGSPEHQNDRNRSIPLSSLLSVLTSCNATYVSLQRDVRAGDEILLQSQSDLLHFGDALKNFSDTAALMANLDLIISVDTGVAHLAGALAKPVWVLLPFMPDWRWLLDRQDSPWYPTARLFRQDETREWDGVVGRVRAALHDYGA